MTDLVKPVAVLVGYEADVLGDGADSDPVFEG